MRKIVAGLAVPVAAVGLLVGLGGIAGAAPVAQNATGAPPPAGPVTEAYAVLAAPNEFDSGRARTSALPSALPDYSGTIVIGV